MVSNGADGRDARGNGLFTAAKLTHTSIPNPVVISGLGPGIHALRLEESKAWILEPSSRMTTEDGDVVS